MYRSSISKPEAKRGRVGAGGLEPPSHYSHEPPPKIEPPFRNLNF